MRQFETYGVIQRNDREIVWRQFVGLGTIVVYLPGRREFLFRGAAEFLWGQLDSPVRVGQLWEQLVGRYHIPRDMARRDATRFVTDIARWSLIHPPLRANADKGGQPSRLIDTNPLVRKYFWDKNVPYMIQLVLTRRCPYRCSHCYLSDLSTFGLRGQILKSVLRDLARLGGLYLKLTGGEVLTRPDLVEVVETATKLNFAWSLNTNGHLLKKEIGRDLALLRPFEVCLSLYGASAASHEVITSPHYA